jgi:hypothetical protein
MLTHPVKEIIPREMENPEVAKTIAQFSSAIEETVNFGSHILKWSSDSATGGDEIAPLILSLRHVLELLDAISILVKASCIYPCELLLRGVLESYFGLEYLFREDRERRAMAFMVCHVHHILETHESHDPTTQTGKKIHKALESDRAMPGVKIREIPELKVETAQLEAVLKKPRYIEAQAEYLRLRSKTKSTPKWYSFYGGPTSVEQLANGLGLSGMYQIFYRSWSGPVHGTDIIRGKILKDDKGGTAIVQIRSVRNAQLVTSLTLSLALKVYHLFFKHMIPERANEYAHWYRGIQDFYLKLSGKPLIQVASTLCV